jgi:hypothetical protein
MRQGRRQPRAAHQRQIVNETKTKLKTSPLRVWIGYCRNQPAYGFSEETTEGKNLEAQAAQAHAGKSPQEAPAL